MPDKTLAPESVSSPASTGGAGVFFEQHVDCYWLALLLTRAIPPILHDCTVTEVHLQTEQLGWSTDDFLVVAENSAGARRKLAGKSSLASLSVRRMMNRRGSFSTTGVTSSEAVSLRWPRTALSW